MQRSLSRITMRIGKWGLLTLAATFLLGFAAPYPTSTYKVLAAAADSTTKPLTEKLFPIRGITIGTTEKTLIQKLGEPNRKDPSEYGFTWFVYNKDYKQYAQIGVAAGRVVAAYSNAAGVKSNAGIAIGTTRKDAEAKLGKPLTTLKIGNTTWKLNDGKELGRYTVGTGIVTLFYDIHAKNTVTSMLVMDKKTATTATATVKNAKLQAAYERELFDLANSVRVRMELAPFKWDDTAAKTARLHSADMAARKFFDHENPDGKSPFDRMEKQGIAYRLAAENIAAGQDNAIFAHESWMNSAGHRKNLLSAIAKFGAGVAFGGEYGIYYTQNFFTPLK
ncbi:CAP domain-containing protein [Cohnella faecalis]|uniref:Copper amine oxidase n=1 Tax=Cohnella faecalis TaxID=2315694 RepID=A0A398CMU9_9BACL|nr:CAP-associated domain-containing protein [Cohnella faecalis]RIE00244.1 copper amine oxidase [Cohnella faecalis]